MSAESVDTLAKDIEYIKATLDDCKGEIGGVGYEIKEWQKKIERDYVSRREYEPVRIIVYGLVSTIMLAFLSGLIYLLLNHGGMK